MEKKLAILEKIGDGEFVEPDVRLKIKFHLDKMTLILQKKLKTMEVITEYSEEFTVDEESPIDDIIHDFYIKYNRLKNIENYWSNNLKNTEVIEFDLTEKDKKD